MATFSQRQQHLDLLVQLVRKVLKGRLGVKEAKVCKVGKERLEARAHKDRQEVKDLLHKTLDEG